MSENCEHRVECRDFFILCSQYGGAVFKVGDHVERIGSLVPQYMRDGIVVRVTPNKDGIERLTECEVTFGDRMLAIFYEAQLRLISTATEDTPSKPSRI